MSTDRLERLLSELQAEVENQREEDLTKAGEWFGRVLDHTHNRNRRTYLLEQMRQAHGLGDGDEKPPAA